MTTDRELLEKAAKAAGIVFDLSPFNGGGVNNTGFNLIGDAVLDWHNGVTWNPLTDDGDAFRLGVKVRAFGNPEFIRHLGAARFALQDQDDTAAYRRAIVWVAASIGEQMP